jgi:hypothetical protein
MYGKLQTPLKNTDLINQFSKVVGCKIIENPEALLCTSNELSKIEIKNIVPLIITKKKLTLEVNLGKIKEIYNENYKTHIKEIKKNA